MIKKFNKNKNFEMNFTKIEKRQETFKVFVFGLLFECIFMEPMNTRYFPSDEIYSRLLHQDFLVTDSNSSISCSMSVSHSLTYSLTKKKRN